MNVIISGGNFGNKGAQAMTYITLFECMKRFPDANYILQFPNGFYTVRSIQELQTLSEIKPESSGSKIQKLKQMLKIYKDADIMLDISGFELAAKLGTYPNLRYLYKIALSKWNKVKVYLMPQSFGPFDYKGLKKLLFMPLIRHYLKYPVVCYAREQQGYEDLKKAAPKANVILSRDMVLQNKEIEVFLENTQIPAALEALLENAVGLIPNSRLNEQCGKERAFLCYRTAIQTLTDKGYTVCLIAHSNGDLQIARQIKDECRENDKVVLLENVLSCFQYQLATRKLRFVVAARFHSVVHAFKEAVPAVALGWAVKYQELLGVFGNEHYCINVERAERKQVAETIECMIENYRTEAEKIRTGLPEIQIENCFDIFGK